MCSQVKQSRKKPLQVKTPRALPTMEAHQVIRANALFLLSLSSAAEGSLLCHHPPKPFHPHLPSLKEGVSDDSSNKISCLYLQTLARYLPLHAVPPNYLKNVRTQSWRTTSAPVICISLCLSKTCTFVLLALISC